MVFAAALQPVAWLVYNAFWGDLGVNPVETITNHTGIWTLRFIVLSLAITPARWLTGFNPLTTFRRPLGLFAFFYGTLHFMTYFVLDHSLAFDGVWEDVVKRPYITAGFTAFVLMIPLALTSTTGWIRRLGGRNWNLLHRLVYISAIGGALHYFWKVKLDTTNPVYYFASRRRAARRPRVEGGDEETRRGAGWRTRGAAGVSPAPGAGEARGPAAGPAVVMLARSPFAVGKTRLTAGLDDTRATALRAALLLDTVESALAAGWPVHLHLDPPEHLAQVQALLVADGALAPRAARVCWHAQGEGDLGARMIAALRTTLAAGHDVAVLVGSDIPDLPPAALVAARDALVATAAGRGVVFGPAADGGFYLVATTDAEVLADAFDGVMWSQPAVLADVTARLDAIGCDVRGVMAWHDLDQPADLTALLSRPSAGAGRTHDVARQLRS